MIFIVIVLLFILLILIKTLLFKPKYSAEVDSEEISFDKNKAISNLQKLVRCKTISYKDPKLENDKEFEKLINLLPKLYPTVIKKAKFLTFDGRGILFHIKGKNKGEPAVFMAHYDVVPVDIDEWNKPTFDGLIEDNIMWGRGTLDTKNTFNGVLMAAETLLSKGFKPEHDMYFAFSGSEEISGIGASEIVKYFKKKNITPAFVLDEGGAVVSNIFPGVSSPCGLVGLAEKGSVNLTLTAKSNGGHASAPKPNSPLVVLSKACQKIEAHPFKAHFNGPARLMFNELGSRSTFLYKMIFANLNVFGWILDLLCRKTGGQLNALLRTTTAFTMANGSPAVNVIPASASLTMNIRINPNDSVEYVKENIKKIINDESIEITIDDPNEPSRVSTVDSDGYRLIAKSIASTWIGCVVAPYLMVQASDSRHYGEISDRVYRFSAADMTDEELDSIHGNNEHIRLDTICRAVEFFIRIMKEC